MDKSEKIKELVILSGKGGCGKTSIAAAFAALSENTHFADCDVDAADLMLVLQPQKIKSEDFYSGELPVINDEECSGCGKCAELCRFSAVKLSADKKYSIRESACEGCGVCVDNCPVSAIKMEPRLCGEWNLSQTPYGRLTHARLGAGGENSGKLVSQVRNEAQKIAQQDRCELIIVDGPPGIGCPVIASLGGAWKCLIVTEPTMSGIHDLQRVLKLTKHFGVRTCVCVNKSDINLKIAGEIEKTAQKAEAIFLGCIPYDTAVTEAQRKGVPVVSHNCQASEAIKQIWKSIISDCD